MKGLKPLLLHQPFDLQQTYTSNPSNEELELERTVLRRNGKLRLCLQSMDECKQVIQKKSAGIQKLKAKNKDVNLDHNKGNINLESKEDGDIVQESEKDQKIALQPMLEEDKSGSEKNGGQQKGERKGSIKLGIKHEKGKTGSLKFEAKQEHEINGIVTSESESEIEDDVAESVSDVLSESDYEINGGSTDRSGVQRKGGITQLKNTDSQSETQTSSLRENRKSSSEKLIANGHMDVKQQPDEGDDIDIPSDCGTETKDMQANYEHFKNKILKHLGEISRLIHEGFLDVFIKHCLPDERIVLGNKMSRSGFLKTLIEFYREVLDLRNTTALTDVELWTHEQTGDDVRFLITTRRLVSDVTSCCAQIATHVSGLDFLPMMLADIQQIVKDRFDRFDKHVSADRNMFIFCSAMTSLYNCVRHPHTDRQSLRKLQLLDNLKPFLKSQHKGVKLMTILVLVYVVTEKELDLLHDSGDVLDFLLERIHEAILSKERLDFDHHISQLVDGITAFVHYNLNKVKLISKHPLTLILRLLESPDQREVLSTLKLVLELAFLEEARQIMLKNSEFMEVVRELMQHDDDDIRTVASYAVFVLHGYELQRKIKPDEHQKQQVMLSYSWADQTHLLMIYNSLKEAGYSVWIDVVELNKYSDILDGVAQAVRQSTLILVCFSEFYKRDSSCRLVAEYAFKLKKQIVPLQVQDGYEPDGWLTDIIGPRFYQSFPPNGPYANQMYRLHECLQRNNASTTGPPLNTHSLPDDGFYRGPSRAYSRGPSRIQSRGPSRGFSIPPSRTISRGPSRAPSRYPVYERKVQDWEQDDVLFWASQFKLEGKAWRTVSKLTVQQILCVHTVWKKTPEKFYNWAESIIQLGSVEDLMRFRNAVRSLSDYV